MAIKISGSTIIDDDRNIVNAGVVTASTISANEFIGTGDKLIFQPKLTSFSPIDGSTDVDRDISISVTFDQQIFPGIGTITLRNSSGIGTIIESISMGSTFFSINNQTLTLSPPYPSGATKLPILTDIYVVLPEGVVVNALGVGNTSISSYNFTTKDLVLGDAYEGGYLICRSGGIEWIVAPSSTQVSRSWYSRADAVTTANANAACGDWFVPSCGQLQNPGYTCNTYWDSVSGEYWSDTEFNDRQAWFVNLGNGTASVGHHRYNNKACAKNVRAFRCLSY